MPTTSTLSLGDSFLIVNLSTATAPAAIRTGSAASLVNLPIQARIRCTVISTSVDTNSAWDIAYENLPIDDPQASTSYGLGTIVPGGIAGTTAASGIAFGTNTSQAAVIIGPVSNQSVGGSINIGQRTSTTNYAKTTINGSTILGAGNTTYAPLNLTSGTSQTSPTAGAIEYDGNAGYFTTTATAGRAVIDLSYFEILSTAKTLSSATGNQAMFNATTNGAFTVAANTSYLFEIVANIITTGASNSFLLNFNFGGTATFTSAYFQTIYSPQTSAGTAGTARHLVWTAATGGNMYTTTSQALANPFQVKGVLRINATGTIIPQIAFSTAPGSSPTQTAPGSYIRLTPIGTDTVASVGSWT